MNINIKQTGLTLIELIVTLAVLSTLLAVGIPQFTSSTANSRMTTTINALSGDFALARTEAVKRAIPVTVTPANISNWAAGGWTVATVAVNASTPSVNLKVAPGSPSGTNITAAATSVRFNANGRSNSAAALTFTLCDNRTGPVGKRMTLNATGQTVLETQIACP